MTRELRTVLLAALCGFCAHAQTATGTLSGVVRDPAGGVIPGAQVSVVNTDKGATRVAVTDAQGRYLLTALDAGTYQLRGEKSGFKTAVLDRVVVTVGGSVVADLALSVGQVNEQVTVQAETPLIEPENPELSRVVAGREIESLPVGGRNFVDFAKLSSNVVQGRENIGGGAFKEPDAGVGASAVPRLSFGGQTELNTLIQVDGVDNIQTFTGLPRATPSLEAANEFRVLNSTYLAEYGRALGGFVNIVTKSGGNENHGSLYYFGENQGLAARPSLVAGNPALRQNQYGATWGGPLVKDRTFFFINYEGQRRAESNKFSQVILANVPAMNAMRASLGLHPEVDSLLRSNDYDQGLLKLDQHFSAKNTLTARYSVQNAVTNGFLGGGGRASPASTTARDSGVRDQSLGLSDVALLSPTIVNEARFQWARRTFDFGSVLKEPDLEVSNLLISGKSTSDPDFYRESNGQFSESLSVLKSGHQLKFGFDYNDWRDQSVWDLFFPARIIFGSFPAFLAFRPNATSGVVNFWWPQLITAATHPGFSLPFTNAVPPQWDSATQFHFDHSAYGFFAQDQWKLNPRWSLTYGLRYDFELYPSRFMARTYRKDLQPRIGLAYSYSPKGVIRAGFGLFGDRIGTSVGQVFQVAEWLSKGNLPNAPLIYPGVAPIQGRFLQMNAVGAAATPAAITFLTTGQVPATGVSTFSDNVDSYLRTPYSVQASIQVSQEIGNGFAISASYLLVHGVKLLASSPNLNALQTGVLATGKPLINGRKYPELGEFVVVENGNASMYHGGTLELEKRFSHGIAFHSSYTFSKTIDRADSISNLADFPEGLTFDRALSRQNVKHRYTLSIITQTPASFGALRDFKLSSLVSVESGRPYTIFAGSDANGDSNPNSDRPGLLGRNTLIGPGFSTWDLRAAREFHFRERWSAEFSFDFFNLLNKLNIRDLNTVYGGIDLTQPPNPLLGYLTPRDVFNPRQIQYGLKVRF